MALVVCLCLAVVATASAALYVYTNNFSRPSDVRELDRTSGGKKVCDIALRKKSKTVRIIARKDKLCGYSPPVFADSDRPNHEIVAKGMVASRTPKSQRRAAYLALRIREDGGDYYEFIVKPKTGRFILDRGSAVAGLPIKGDSNKVKTLGENNLLRLKARGSKVTAHVNGEKVATFTDPSPGVVDGRSTSFGLGSTKDSVKVPIGRFTQVKVGVPNA
ncbi:hypothetical protein BH24ACT23_BH24ACT23_12480 [soil metagenome]